MLEDEQVRILRASYERAWTRTLRTTAADEQLQFYATILSDYSVATTLTTIKLLDRIARISAYKLKFAGGFLQD